MNRKTDWHTVIIFCISVRCTGVELKLIAYRYYYFWNLARAYIQIISMLSLSIQ